MKDGIYEQVINNYIQNYLISTEKYREIRPIEKEEAAKILAKYVVEIVERGLSYIYAEEKEISSQIGLVNHIIETIIHDTKANDLKQYSLPDSANQLLALYDKNNSALALNQGNNITILQMGNLEF